MSLNQASHLPPTNSRSMVRARMSSIGKMASTSFIRRMRWRRLEFPRLVFFGSIRHAMGSPTPLRITVTTKMLMWDLPNFQFVRKLCWLANNWFQSAPLLRGATCVRLRSRWDRQVSIRAPLARGDRTESP